MLGTIPMHVNLPSFETGAVGVPFLPDFTPWTVESAARCDRTHPSGSAHRAAHGPPF